MVLKITFRRAFGEGAIVGHDTPDDTGDLTGDDGQSEAMCFVSITMSIVNSFEVVMFFTNGLSGHKQRPAQEGRSALTDMGNTVNGIAGIADTRIKSAKGDILFWSGKEVKRSAFGEDGRGDFRAHTERSQRAIDRSHPILQIECDFTNLIFGKIKKIGNHSQLSINDCFADFRADGVFGFQKQFVDRRIGKASVTCGFERFKRFSLLFENHV